MSNILWYALGMPFIIVATVMSYIVWEVFSTGEWKKRKSGLRPELLVYGEVTYLHHKMREMAYAHRTEVDELKQRHRQELFQLKRNYQLAERVGR
jgi:hypothetical protein